MVKFVKSLHQCCVHCHRAGCLVSPPCPFLGQHQFYSVSNVNLIFQVQEIGDTTLTLTTPSDLNDPNLAPPVALQIAARLNLIENAINDLRTPNCN